LGLLQTASLCPCLPARIQRDHRYNRKVKKEYAADKSLQTRLFVHSASQLKFLRISKFSPPPEKRFFSINAPENKAKTKGLSSQMVVGFKKKFGSAD
jgi:hypothetical protein